MYSVLIADDHEFSASGLSAALSRSGAFDVVAQAKDGIEAITQTKVHQPDLAVFDMIMPGVSGLEAMIEARRWSPKTRFAVLTGGATTQQLRAVIEAGANGLFIKTMSPDQICQGLLQVAHGETVISNQAGHLLERDDSTAEMKARLTPREIEVLRGISRGWSNAVMADHLGLSTKTVDSHRTSLMSKMDVHSSAALIMRAVRDGLISTDDPI